MKKLAEFIVKKKIPILIVFSIATIVCAIMSNYVTLNYDMISYLPADSQVKKGVRLMNEQFDEVTTINVMFKGLSDEEKQKLPDEIEAVEGVSGVTYDADSEDYNNGDNTLYVVNMPGNGYLESNSDVLKALKDKFGGYDVYYNGITVDNLALNDSLTRIIIVALILLFIILILMCASFAEPVLFLIAIGMAVLINMGTNIIFPGIAQITNSIAAVLQLVLSMDYSVMLIDRYRQERKKTSDKEAAMQNALEKGFLSISSSSVTTIVGLLCLIFMSFLIGRDLGLVLAKGVLLSLICILFVLPGLILLADKLIAKTAKPVLHIPMGGLAKFSYKARYAVLGVFAVLFLGAFLLKGNVKIDYYTSNSNKDAAVIEEAFPPDNTLVVLYDNGSEAQMAEVDAWASAQPGVTGTAGFGSTLGRKLTAQELADSMGMDVSLLTILYYKYFDGATGSITAGDFIDFIFNEVADNEQFSGFFDEGMKAKLEQFRCFADPAELKQERNAQWYADLLGLKADDVNGLFALYYQIYGGVETGTMTFNTFVDFLLDDVAGSAQYAGMLGTDMTEQLQKLKLFADPETVSRLCSSSELSELMGMDQKLIDQIFLLYFGGQEAGDGKMTVPTMVSFLRKEVMNSEQFSSYFDDKTRAQINNAAVFTDKNLIQRPLGKEELAERLGMDSAQLGQLFYLYFSKAGTTDAWTMTMPQFLDFLVNYVLNDENYAPYFDESAALGLTKMNDLAAAAAAGRTFTQKELSGMLNMDSDLVGQIFYLYYTAAGKTSDWAVTLPDFVGFIVNDVSKMPAYASYFDEATLAGLTSTQSLFGMVLSGENYDAQRLAAATGMEPEAVEQIFLASSQAQGSTVTSMTLPVFAKLVMDGYADNLDDSARAGLTLITAAASGEKYGAGRLSELLGVDSYMTSQILFLYYTLDGATADWALTLPQFMDFVCDHVASNEEFEMYFDEDTLKALNTMRGTVDAAEAEKTFSSAQMAELLGMDPEMTGQLYYMVFESAGVTADWKLSLYEFADFLVNDVAKDKVYSSYLDGSSLPQVQTMLALMDASVKGRLFSADEMAKLFGMDPEMMEILYAYHMQINGNAGEWKMSLRQLLDYVVTDLAGNPEFSSYLDEETLSQLTLVRAVADGAAAGKPYTPKELSELLGTGEADMDTLFLYYTSLHGDNGRLTLKIPEFVNFLAKDVAESEYGVMLDVDAKKQISMLQEIVEGALEGRVYSAAELSDLLAGFGEEMDAGQLNLLYLYYFSEHNADAANMLTISEFLDYVIDQILPDGQFAPYFDESVKEELMDAKLLLADGEAQLKGADYSRFMISTSFGRESGDAYEFIDGLNAHLEGLVKESYVVGDSAVANEMQKTFSQQMNFITLLTIIAIFLVVVVTFRSFSVPAVLVLLIQCAIYITMGITYIQGVGIYYLAMIIVQAILMGATIDYAILFTSYYRTLREEESIPDALKASYEGSINTILTSSLILVGVTLAVGLITGDPTTAQVVLTISKGSAIAVLLVIFVLPGVLAALDRFVCGKKRKANHN